LFQHQKVPALKMLEEAMNVHVAQEILIELGASLEAQETQNAALLQILKDKGIITDEQLAPYLNQASNASNVRWRAARLRLERIFASATKEEDKAVEKGQSQSAREQPSHQNLEQPAKDKPTEDAAGTTPKEAAPAEQVKKENEDVETSPHIAREERHEGTNLAPAKPKDEAA
jgi:hypothetical protein